jgi:AbrB family looped-hinge helix DNA binding protein
MNEPATDTSTRTYSARIRPRGQITIPQALRDALSLEEGDILSATQYGEGILLTPRPLRTPALAEQFTTIMDEEGVTLADLLAGLAEERDRLWRERQTSAT